MQVFVTNEFAPGVNALSYNGASQTTSLNTTGGIAAMTYGGVTQDHLHANGGITYTSPAGLGITNEYLASNWNYDQTRAPDGTLINTTQHLNSVNTTDYYLLDGQGSVVGLTDAAGNVANAYAYDDWGNTTSTTGTVINFFGYKSAIAIGSLHKFGTRWYNSQTGTFTQPDPQPAANPYTYANNNPVNYSDPSGRFCLAGTNPNGSCRGASEVEGCAKGAVQGVAVASITGAGAVVSGVGGCGVGAGAAYGDNRYDSGGKTFEYLADLHDGVDVLASFL